MAETTAMGIPVNRYGMGLTAASLIGGAVRSFGPDTITNNIPLLNMIPHEAAPALGLLGAGIGLGLTCIE